MISGLLAVILDYRRRVLRLATRGHFRDDHVNLQRFSRLASQAMRAIGLTPLLWSILRTTMVTNVINDRYLVIFRTILAQARVPRHLVPTLLGLLVLHLRLSLLHFFLVRLLNFNLLFLLDDGCGLDLLVDVLLNVFRTFLRIFRFVTILLVLVRNLFVTTLRGHLLIVNHDLFLRRVGLLVAR